jgi:hypothetical protein
VQLPGRRTSPPCQAGPDAHINWVRLPGRRTSPPCQAGPDAQAACAIQAGAAQRSGLGGGQSASLAQAAQCRATIGIASHRQGRTAASSLPASSPPRRSVRCNSFSRSGSTSYITNRPSLYRWAAQLRGQPPLSACGQRGGRGGGRGGRQTCAQRDDGGGRSCCDRCRRRTGRVELKHEPFLPLPSPSVVAPLCAAGAATTELFTRSAG